MTSSLLKLAAALLLLLATQLSFAAPAPFTGSSSADADQPFDQQIRAASRAADAAAFEALLAGVPGPALHAALHRFSPSRFQHGVFAQDSRAADAVLSAELPAELRARPQAEAAAASAAAVVVGKRQNSPSDNGTLPTPPPGSTTVTSTITVPGSTSVVVVTSTSQIPPPTTSTTAPATTTPSTTSAVTTTSTTTTPATTSQSVVVETTTLPSQGVSTMTALTIVNAPPSSASQAQSSSATAQATGSLQSPNAAPPRLAGSPWPLGVAVAALLLGVAV